MNQIKDDMGVVTGGKFYIRTVAYAAWAMVRNGKVKSYTRLIKKDKGDRVVVRFGNEDVELYVRNESRREI